MTKRKKTSSEGPESQTTDSVFDFLYHDARRIASLLAQFDPSGHLQSILLGRSAEEGRDSDASLTFSGGIPGLASGKNDTKEQIRRSHAQDIQRVYDPMWSNARALLDTLDEQGLIQRNLEPSETGQLVLITGSLTIHDLQMLSGMWQMQAVQKLIAQAIPELPKSKKGRSETPEYREAVRLAKQAREEYEASSQLFTELIPTLPHATQVQITDDAGDRVWCTVDASGLAMPASDIALKHGLSVPGRWAMLGILDALPENVDEEIRQQTPDGSEMLAKLYESMVPMLRTMLGRPKDAYGVTPLMIFREVIAAP